MDVPCNRQFKMYSKCSSNSSLASSSSCATAAANSASAFHHTSSRASLQDAFSQLNVGHERSLSIASSTSSTGNIYSNCLATSQQPSSQPPPRPPKPVLFRLEGPTSAQSEDELSLSAAPSWLGLRPLSREPSASLSSSTNMPIYGSVSGFAQLHGYASSYGVNTGHQRPKNSVSSSCSSNPSPPSSGREGKEDSIFKFDTVNNDQSDSSQPSSPFDSCISNRRPPNINRALKPRKPSDFNRNRQV